MKKLLTGLIAAACAAWGMGARAATQLAVWDGASTTCNFSTTTSGNYTLAANDNTVAADGSTITIGSKGIAITSSTETAWTYSDGTTVIVKYSSRPSSAGAFCSFCSGSNNVGASFDASAKMLGIWNGNAYGTADGDVAESGTVFYVNNSTASWIYNASATQLYYSTALKSSGNIGTWFTVGSNYGSGSYNGLVATGMVIEGIAIYKGCLTTDEIKSFKWPSEVTTYTATISGDTNWSDVQWDTALPADLSSASVTINGTGTVKGYNGAADSAAIFTVASGITLEYTKDYPATCPAGWNYSFVADDYKTEKSITVTPIAGNLTLGAGIWSLTGGNRTLTGTLTIDSDATCKPQTGDNANYNGSCTINVKGVLDMGSTRWTLASGNVLNLYTGSEVKGIGDQYAALDFNVSGVCAINVIDSGDESKTATVSAAIRDAQANNNVVTVAEGCTLKMTSTVNGTKTFIKQGEGTWDITGASFGSNTITVKAGAINVAVAADTEVTNVHSTDGGFINLVGSGVYNLGTSRPSIGTVDSCTLKFIATDDEVIAKAVSLTTATGLDITGATIAKVSTVLDSAGNTLTVDADASTYASDTGIISLKLVTTLPVITEESTISELSLASSDAGVLVIQGAATAEDAFTVTFDTDLPSGVTVSVNGYVNLAIGGSVTELPTGKIAFASGSVATTTVAPTAAVEIASGATLVIDASAGEMTVTGAISGAGAVKIVGGTVTFSTANTFTGGLTVCDGAIAKNTLIADNNPAGFGPMNGKITVENGGAVDLNNTINVSYQFVIAGKGYELEDGSYSGALYNSGSAIDNGKRQASSTSLTADATITADTAWGLVASGYVATTLALNGYTLTKQGEAAFWLTNTSVGAGKIAIAEGYIETVTKDVTFSGAVAIEIASGAAFRADTAISGTVPTFSGDGVVRLAGGTLAMGNGNTSSMGTRVEAISGTSTFDWGMGSPTAECFSGDTIDNPFISIASGATLNLGVKDFSGWNGSVTDGGWIVNAGTLNIDEYNGSRYFRGHFVLNPGTTTTVNGSTNQLYIYGGEATEATAQIYVPAGEGTATVTGSAVYLGQSGSQGTHGCGVTVKDGSTLKMTTYGVYGSTSDPVAKYGNGTWIIAPGEGGCTIGTVSLNAGTIKSTTELTVQKGDGAKGYQLKTSTETIDGVDYYVYSLKKQFIIRIR